MAITDWPTAERPREKLLNRGPQTLSDAELLAIFLRTGVSGKTAVDLARDLLKEYGGLRALLEADRRNFCQGHGLGSAKYALLQAVLEMGRRHLYETVQRGDALGSPTDTRRFLLARLRDYPHEVFACLFLDNDCRLTRRLQDALGLVDIRVLDHIVIGDGYTISLAERGQL
ncbi:MAG: JAB domain-containing protein [Gammaproteobacteria bacterium]